MTFRQEQTRLGEALEAASEQTGVNLKTEEKGGAAGEIASIYVHNLPLSDFMTALWSLVSYRGAVWRWEKEEEKGAPAVYRLIKTPAAQSFPRRLQDSVRQYQRDALEMSIAGLNMPKEEGIQAAKSFPESVAVLSDDRSRCEMFAFQSLAPTPEQRERLLKGEITLEIPRSKWPDEVKVYVREEMELSNQLNPGNPVPEPQSISIESTPDGFGQASTNLWFRFDTMGGGILTGGMQTARYWQWEIKAQWLLQGDMVTDANQGSKIVKASPAPPPTVRDVPGVGAVTIERQLSGAEWLSSLHRATDIPIMARLMGDTLKLPGWIPRSSLADAVKRIQDTQRMTKWRNGILLVTYPGWMNNAVASESKLSLWKPLKEFRAEAMTSREIPSLESFARLAVSLTERQIEFLGEQNNLFAEPSSMTAILCSQLKSLRPFLVVLQTSPNLGTRLTSGMGVPVRDLPQSLREIVRQRFNGSLPSNAVLRITRYDLAPAETSPKSFADKTMTQRWQWDFIEQDTSSKLLAPSLMIDWIKGAVPERKPESKKEVSTLAIE